MLSTSVLAMLSGCNSKGKQSGEVKLPAHESRVVLLQEDGEDRHWVIKNKGLILEEHGLTAHGDLHVIAEYPKGVRKPQFDAAERDETAEAVSTIFWPNGNRMCRTHIIGAKENGKDLVWWPNGNLAREADFSMGAPNGTWSFFDQAGKLVGEGTFQDGVRMTGAFIGNDRSGSDYFLSGFPMKKQIFENGAMKAEDVFLEELNIQ